MFVRVCVSGLMRLGHKPKGEFMALWEEACVQSKLQGLPRETLELLKEGQSVTRWQGSSLLACLA